MDIFEAIDKDPELRKALVQGMSNTSNKSITSICHTLRICDACFKDIYGNNHNQCFSGFDIPNEPDVTQYDKQELDTIASEDDKMEQIKQLYLLTKRNKVQGIKILRHLFGYSLKEAKLLFEHYLEPYLK